MSINLKELNSNPFSYGSNLSIDDLMTFIVKCNEAYHEGTPIVEDNVYDILTDILEKHDTKNKVLKNIGFKGLNDKHKLPYFMASMNKVKNYDNFKKWITKYNDIDEFVISEKLDGISALLDAHNGEIKIYTRGNGAYGRDITHLKDYINIPKVNDITVRGELIISRKVFNENRGSYSNIRNMVCGLLNNKGHNNQLKLLEFVVFELIRPVLLPESHESEVKSKGFTYVRNIKLSYNELLNYNNDNNYYILNLLNKFRQTTIYDIDGIIITHNNIYDREKKNPKHSIAFKNNNNGKITTVRDIVWSISKYGIIIPRIKFDKIDLGSSVEYCTGFSGKFIFNNSLGPGSKIRVVLSGDVIPYIVEVISSTYPKMPKINYKWNSTKVHIVTCEFNDVSLNKKVIVHFIKSVKIDNISIGLVNKLYDEGYNTIYKILNITKEQLLEISGIKETLATKIVNNISKVISNEIDLGVLMVASLKFNHGFGIKKINKILEKYPNLMNTNVSIEQISDIDGFHIKTAAQFVDNLDKFKEFLKTLDFIKYKVNIKSKVVTETNSIFTNKKIVFTGFRDSSLQEYIEKCGGTIQSSFNNKTDILIVKDKTCSSSKIDAAVMLGKKIIYKDQIEF